MRVVIRVDASVRVGLGHLARVRNLAAGLRAWGAAVCFVCRAHPGDQIGALRADGFQVMALPAPPAGDCTVDEVDAGYSAWLGVPEMQDAADTLAALEREPATGASATGNPAGLSRGWLVVDHYAIGGDWEGLFRSSFDRILVIDDLADRRHDCDLLVDQNFVSNSLGRYRSLVPNGAVTLLGPEYALLRPEYADTRQSLGRRDGRLRRVLVFFGGTDAGDLSGRALAALNHPTLCHLAVDIVVGANYSHGARLAAAAAECPNIRLHGPRAHLADLMAGADIAIGAGGITTWERCCLGLPSLVVSIADNQRGSCEALAAAGVIEYLGHLDRVSVATITAALREIAKEPAKLRALSHAGLSIVDGLGVSRVIESMLSTGTG